MDHWKVSSGVMESEWHRPELCVREVVRSLGTIAMEYLVKGAEWSVTVLYIGSIYFCVSQQVGEVSRASWRMGDVGFGVSSHSHRISKLIGSRETRAESLDFSRAGKA